MATKTDRAHLNALEVRMSHERGYLAAEKSDAGRALRTVWIAQIEKEISGEMKFLGIEAAEPNDMTDDDLLADLGV